MRLVWILVLAAFVSGCAQPVAKNGFQRPGPSEAYVDLRPYVFNGKFTVYDSPEALIAKLGSLGGEQGKYETDAEFTSRMSGMGLSAVMSEIKDYQVDFDKSNGSLTFRQSMEDAQLHGFRSGSSSLSDYKNSYYSLMLPGVEHKTGEFVGQNSYGAKAVVDKVQIDRVTLVGPAVPKQPVGIVFVDLLARLKMTASEFNSQRNDLRLAVIFEPIPNYLQKYTGYGTATVTNKREATVNNYFLSSKIAAVSVVNIKTNQVVSDGARVRFKTH
ncbi:hypothetical protein MXL15_21070 [Pseudomonas mosselii]|uniref:hypothetical protein n=1 Tax=Pseudomonas mosselii TaxID=78327 RepID=UPI002DB7A975|nr:hypothetical protein [Pseudomonas mosselii]MEB5934695.1 hypothetical protein [Pseudomonas mosselii]